MVISDLNYLEEVSDKELTVQAGTSLSSSYSTTSLSQQSCLNRAVSTLRQTVWFDIGTSSSGAYGFYGDYVAQIVCATSNDLAYFNVAGPNSATASLYRNQIATTF